MLFFIWLAGGAAVYSRLEGWRFIDAVRAGSHQAVFSQLILTAILR